MRANIVVLLVAAVLGFVGGTVSNLVRAGGASTPDIIRAYRFELVDHDGRPRAFWGVDSGGNTVISFLSRESKSPGAESVNPELAPFTGQNREELAGFGLLSDGSPFLNLMGGDGKSRVILYVDGQQKHLLGMSDEKYEGRLLLGFIPFDSPSPEDDDWGLQFRHPNLASFGVLRDPVTGSSSGTIAVQNAKGKVWRAP